MWSCLGASRVGASPWKTRRLVYVARAFWNDVRAAAPYDPSMDGEGFVLSGQAAYLASTAVFAGVGIMQWSVGL